MADCIVIGAGPNGLAAATTLARAGHKVQLFEARESLGGRAAGEEFHPGFRSPGTLHDTERVQPWVIEALGLRSHGLTTRSAAPVVTVGDNQETRVLPHPDLSDWQREVFTTRPLIQKLCAAPPPDIGSTAPIWPLVSPALSALRLGRDRVMDWLRVGPLCLDDWLTEWFDDPILQAGVSLPALMGTWMGPRSPTSATALLFSTALAGDEIVGGPAGLVAALTAAATQAGVQFQTGTAVTRIQLDQGHVAGLTLADGSEVKATQVLSSIGARRTLLNLVDPTHLPFAAERAATPIRLRGLVAKLDLALSGPLPVPGQDGSTFSRIRIAPDLRTLEKAFDAAKHRRMPDTPALDIRIPSLEDPGLAPADHHVASILVYGVAHDLDAGWNDDTRKQLGDRVRETLERYLPGSTELILAERMRSPADLEQDLGLEGGHLFHGELGLDQILSFRPHTHLARYTTPIPGLVLGGAGMHPAGGFTCAQGVLAARTMR